MRPHGSHALLLTFCATALRPAAHRRPHRTTLKSTATIDEIAGGAELTGFAAAVEAEVVRRYGAAETERARTSAADIILQRSSARVEDVRELISKDGGNASSTRVEI